MDLSNIISRTDNYIFNEVDDDLVMMNKEDASYTYLNETGKSIWRLLDTPKSVGELVEALLLEYSVDREQCILQVNDFVQKMSQKEMVLVQ